MKACIVVPTIREENIQQFLSAWELQFKQHRVIVVEDNPERSFRLPEWVASHVSWREIEAHLGEDAWIISRRSGGIRTYGLLLAAAYEPDMIVMLDDDCLPNDDQPLLGRHWETLETPGSQFPVFDTMWSLGLTSQAAGIRARGFPKEARQPRTVLNHGLWNGVPDIDGETQLRHGALRTEFADHSLQIPRGTLFPMSAMNVSFRPEILPAMYQMPMGQGQPYHRFDDIWCGFVMKKACDILGLSVRSGSPCVKHVRASNAERNAELEAPGIVENQRVWKLIDEMSLQQLRSPGLVSTELRVCECLDQIHESLASLGTYWSRAKQAASVWRQLVFQAQFRGAA